MKLRELEKILRGIRVKIYFNGFTIETRVCEIKDLSVELLNREVLRIDLENNEIQLSNFKEDILADYCERHNFPIEEAHNILIEYISYGYDKTDAIECVLDEILAASE